MLSTFFLSAHPSIMGGLICMQQWPQIFSRYQRAFKTRMKLSKQTQLHSQLHTHTQPPTFPCSLSVVHFFFWLTLHYKYKSLPQDFSSLSKTCEETPSSDIRDREHPRQHLAFVPSLFPSVTVTACIWVSWREPPQVISSLSLSFALSFSLVQLLFLVSCTFHRLPLERGVRSTEQPSERKKKLKPCVVQESAPAWWAWSCCLQPSFASSPTCCSSSPTGSNWRPARSPPRSGSWGGSSEEAWLWVNQFHAESLVKCFIAHFYWVFQPLRFVV